MSRKAIPAIVLTWALSLTAPAQAGTPTDETRIPVFTGAQRDQAAEAEERSLRGQDPSGEGGPAVQAAWIRVYRVSAAAEEVFRFYKDALGARPDDGGGAEGATLAPGASSPVSYSAYTHDEGDFADRSGEDGTFPGRRLWAAMTKDRKPLPEGGWLQEAQFAWRKGEKDGGETWFGVDVLDDSIREPDGVKTPDHAYRRGTKIVMTKETGLSIEAAAESERERGREELDQAVDARARALASRPPTESELGVPPYPGAKLDAENSAGMSQDDYPAWIFLTSDPVKTVVAFYEGRTGKKAVPGDLGGFMIPLKGSLPLPDHGVVIQPNTMFPGGYKTVITIMKKVR